MPKERKFHAVKHDSQDAKARSNKLDPVLITAQLQQSGMLNTKSKAMSESLQKRNAGLCTNTMCTCRRTPGMQGCARTPCANVKEDQECKATRTQPMRDTEEAQGQTGK